jgi:hypothetical protein
MIVAADELRHGSGDDTRWRESLYFCFADAATQLGGWIYVWVHPNRPRRSGVLVCLYHGLHLSPSALADARSAPNHSVWFPDGSWIYCNYVSVPDLISQDFDEIHGAGLNLRRLGPLRGYQISYDDGTGTRLAIEYQFTSLPWDYREGVNDSPKWLAQNRYHRSGAAQGVVEIDSRRLVLSATGDSDHSWGVRDNVAMGGGDFTYWAFQHPSGDPTCSVILTGAGDDKAVLGFLKLDDLSESMQRIDVVTRFGDEALQRGIAIKLTDRAGRVLRATMDRPYAAVHSGITENWCWGYEAVGSYQVDGFGECQGLASYFWSATSSVEDLLAAQVWHG